MRVGHAFVKREVILRNKNIYTEDKKTPDKIIEFIKENFVMIKKGIVIIRKKQKDTTNMRNPLLLTITSSLLLLPIILFIIFLSLLYYPFFPLSKHCIET